MRADMQELKRKFPLIQGLEQEKELIWLNENLTDIKTAMEGLPISADDMDEAECRWQRFASFIKKRFLRQKNLMVS